MLALLLRNFRADNIIYSEPCVITGSPPVMGEASGTFGIQGSYVGGGPAFTRAAFVYTRVGSTWVALFNHVETKNGVDTKNTWPFGSGVGTAAGIFVPKTFTQTLGVCGAPQVNDVDIYGHAVFMTNP